MLVELMAVTALICLLLAACGLLVRHSGLDDRAIKALRSGLEEER